MPGGRARWTGSDSDMNPINDLLNLVGGFISGIISSIFSFSPFLAEAITMGLAAVILCTFAALSFMGLT